MIEEKEVTNSEVKPVENISRNLQGYPNLSHIEQECQESLIQRKIHI